MNQFRKKENKFVVKAQIIKDGKLHDSISTDVFTFEPTPKGHYNKIKEDLTESYKKLFPTSSIAIVFLP